MLYGMNGFGSPDGLGAFADAVAGSRTGGARTGMSQTTLALQQAYRAAKAKQAAEAQAKADAEARGGEAAGEPEKSNMAYYAIGGVLLVGAVAYYLYNNKR